jgi:hypothetical protein
MARGWLVFPVDLNRKLHTIEGVGEAEATAGEHRRGIPDWYSSRTMKGGAAKPYPKEKHIGPIDPDASTLNQFLNSLDAPPRMFSWTAERFWARSLSTAALIAPAGPQARDSRAGDQERDAGSLTITFPPLLMFQLNAREDSCLF